MFATGEAIISEERRAWQPLTIGLAAQENVSDEKTSAGDIESGDPESSRLVLRTSRVHPTDDKKQD